MIEVTLPAKIDLILFALYWILAIAFMALA